MDTDAFRLSYGLMLRRTAARNAYFTRYCLVESLLLLIRHGDSCLDAAHALTKGRADLDKPRQGAARHPKWRPIYYALLLASLHARHLLLALFGPVAPPVRDVR